MTTIWEPNGSHFAKDALTGTLKSSNEVRALWECFAHIQEGEGFRGCGLILGLSLEKPEVRA